MSQTPWFIKDRKINIGLAGCGRIAQNHLKAIQAHPDTLQLVSVCDTNLEALNATTKEYEVDGFSSLEEMLKHSELDIVTICTPSGLHPT